MVTKSFEFRPHHEAEIISPENNESKKQADLIWSQLLETVKTNITGIKYNTWFKPIKVISLSGDYLQISVPSKDFFDIVITRFGQMIHKILLSLLNKDIKIGYVIESRDILCDPSSLKSIGIQDNAKINSEDTKQLKLLKTNHNSQNTNFPYSISSVLNPEYNFECFVKGKNNEFALAAAQSISNKPGAQYNPLLIYGGVGLGKTHLVQAIANNLLSANPTTKLMYISGPEFTTSFVQSIFSGKIHEFEKFYKSLDVLLLDDIQFMEGKDGTQDCFFQIFNSLYQLKKQIVLSCDKPAHQLEGLEERLITRFQWGLTVDIQLPDLETRIAILNKKCESENIFVSYEILEFVALNIKDNIRSLEGCLKGMIFDSELYKTTINLEIAKRNIIKFGFIKNRRQNLDIASIIIAVARFFDIDESLIRLKTKRQEVVLARQCAMFFAKELTSCSLQTIGAHFGGRNHATVIHACKCMEKKINKDAVFSKKIEKLREELLTS